MFLEQYPTAVARYAMRLFYHKRHIKVNRFFKKNCRMRKKLKNERKTAKFLSKT